MKVVLAEAALAELIEIGRYIKRDNPRRAETFVRELHACCRQLGRMPRAFPLLPTHETSGIRRRVHGQYLIFYRVDAETVEVLHVLHGARDYEPILFPDD